MRTKAETMGAFIDAVYAIAVTILALEIPHTLGDGPFVFASFAAGILEYVLAFALLFSFWLQHRQANALVEEVDRGGLWVNAAVLMLVCLVPRATTLVFDLGGDVTLGALEGSFLRRAGWTTAEAVDLFYVVVVVLIDVGILALVRINAGRAPGDHATGLHRSKAATTSLLVLAVGASFLLPVENRYFLVLIPVVLLFEKEVSSAVRRLSRARNSGGLSR